ncbi:MAG: hypothetical protein GC164_15120 [Phycisphaera sp.]|nr:hypothetical protein [Phycisphaera sp.]
MTNPDAQPVVTRFAPSPTGRLHVGGARTALYSWAYARGRGGKFLLRLEDTDRKRSTEESARSIVEDLRWLGLDWDGVEGSPDGIPRQSQRLDRYHEIVRQLISGGLAYESDGAVRFRMGQDITFDDAVYGTITTPGKDLEDFVILKARDEAGLAYPTFHLAVVVDDADMGVTHVIRGQEHLSNTPKHAALIDALGFKRPVWAHTPSIMNPDGSKMSKRDKAKAARSAAKISKAEGPPEVNQTRLAAFLNKDNDDADIAQAIADHLHLALPEIEVADFRRSGYLPQVVCNYITLLGWNPGENIERFDMKFLAERFDLSRINKANSKFDRDKLKAFNAQTIQQLPPDEWRALLKAHTQAFGPGSLNELDDARFALVANAYQPRSTTLADPAQLGAFFFIDDSKLTYDAKAVDKTLAKNDGEGYSVLRELLPVLAAIDPWSGRAAEDKMKALAEARSLGMGKVAQPVRVAVTGSTVSPSIHETLDLLGKDRTLARIRRCLGQGG